MRQHLFGAALVIGLLGLTAPAMACVTLHVRAGAPAGGDGLTWETAYRTVQRALSQARIPENDVCEIRVAAGVYEPDQLENDPTGTGDRAAIFELVDGVPLLGGYAGKGEDPDARDVAKHETVLSGDLDRNDGPDFTNRDDNSFIIVQALGDVAVMTIDGFTIRGANGRGEYEFFDGGMFNTSPASITRCTFRDNSAFAGGGLSDHGGTVRECRFVGNRAWRGAGAYQSGRSIMVDCTFEENEAEDGGGGAWFNGIVRIDRCQFLGNSGVNGGGVWLSFSSSPEGAVQFLTNSLFVGNAAERGGGLFVGLSTRVTNCTFVLNTASLGGGGIAFDAPLQFAKVANCIVYDNDDPQVEGFESPGDEPFEVTYSIVEGGYPGDGNLDVDPLLTDGYRLRQGSPAIDAGRSDALEIDLTEDLYGDPRFHDDPGTPDTGVPDGRGPVDIGATEFQGTTCLGDVDASGAVDFDDLLRVLGAWGPCPPQDPCEEDVDRSGAVDFGDLLIVLNGWGPCP